MGKIVVSENVSLDGLADGKRLFDYVGQIKGEAGKVLLDEALGTEALLLGRHGYEFYPVVLGAGELLFGKTSDKKPMRLVSARTIGDGIALLTYRPSACADS